MIIQSIVNLAEICYRHGISHAVISPGSRNAPIILALSRHPHIRCHVIPDERSAGYVALGMAQALNAPVLITCTSGTAALNLSPAIAEAYFQQIPLVVLTADRPAEWIDQRDGQAIHQKDLYGTHVKSSKQVPPESNVPDAAWHSDRLVSEAILTAIRPPQGPVHLNIPIREPFYPEAGEVYDYNHPVKVILEERTSYDLPDGLWREAFDEINKKNRVMIVAGQADPDHENHTLLARMSEKFKIPVLGEVVSNLPHFGSLITSQDQILDRLQHNTDQDLAPDLVISFGKSILSKKLKTFLRTATGVSHWHVGIESNAPDTYQSLTRSLSIDPDTFFRRLLGPGSITQRKNQHHFFSIWKQLQDEVSAKVGDFFPVEPFGEFDSVGLILQYLSKDTVLHLSNSMPVRYAQISWSTSNPSIGAVYANRGTSGIDGCNSTMIGHAMITSQSTHVLITGDMAFFYDRNAFWHNDLSSNIRIIILNNHGGGIFRLINGPDRQPELEKYFETKQSLTAVNTAADFGFEYNSCTTREALKNILPGFLSEQGGPKILEIITKARQTNPCGSILITI